MHMGRCTGGSKCVFVEVTGTCGYFPQSVSTLLIETCSLAEPKCQQALGTVLSVFPVLGLEVHTDMLDFYVACGDPHAYATHTDLLSYFPSLEFHFFHLVFLCLRG